MYEILGLKHVFSTFQETIYGATLKRMRSSVYLLRDFPLDFPNSLDQSIGQQLQSTLNQQRLALRHAL